MKRLNTLLYIVLALTLLSFGFNSFAQVQIATNYYYNNFDGGELGIGITQRGNSAGLTLSAQAANNLAVENGYSLMSSGNNTPASYQFNFLSNSTDLNTETFGWEWTFIYKNSSNTANSTDVIVPGQNAWKYWFLSSGNFDNPNTGYYLTQDGSSLKLRWRYSNEPWENRYNELAFFDMSSLGSGWQNKTYAIRVQRLKRRSDFVWHLYVDEYTSANREARTERGNPAYHSTINTYTDTNSGLHINSTSAGRFQFDEIKMYAMKFQLQGANDAAFGISSPLYNGQKNAVIYGLQVMTRGLFDINTLILDLSVSDGSKGVGAIFENAKLFKSTDNYFGNADDVSVTNLTIDWRQIKAENFAKTRLFTTGAADGSMLPAAYYCVKADVKSDAPSGVTYNFTNLVKVGGEAAQIDYVAQNGVNAGGTTTNPSTSGSTKDWTGASNSNSNWSNPDNWLPIGVPDVNDLARIGVVSYGNKPNPTVTATQTVGNVVFGTNINTASTTLTINANAILTVNNNLENNSTATIGGIGTLEVKGTFIAKPSTAPVKTTTSNVATLNAINLLLNSTSTGVLFNANGTNLLIKNAIQTSGTNTATFTLGTGSTLTLTGASPFSLGASTNTITLDNNSTVVYGAAVKQTINTTLSYKNISFSGAGTKEIGNGTLNVSGNWNSTGGKINLTAGSVSFNGTNQTITDATSDNDNGVTFGNVSLTGGIKTLAGNGKFALAVCRFLTLGANTILQTSGKLTLKASVLGSASVAAVPPSSSIQGSVTVERYVQGGAKDMWRSYRMFSSPVYDNNGANKTYSFTQFIDNMLITGKSAGFDQINNSATGAWTYNNGFVAIPSINTAVDVGRGAYILYRGDRTNGVAKVSVPYVDPETIIMDFKGTLNQQSVHVPLTHGSTTFSFLGNPYAATIDWTLVQKNNVEATIRIWNPEKKQYATHNGQHGINGGARYIGPGQGFFVQTTNNSSPYVTFTENSKVSNVAQSVPLYNKVMSVRDNTIGSSFSTSNSVTEEAPVQVRIKLQRDGFDNQDETLVLLQKNELATLSGYDVERTGGEAVFLSSLSAEGKKMAINYMPHISTLSVINLDVNMSNNGGHKMTIDLTDVPLGYELKLRDKLLNTFTDLSAEGTTYALTVDKTQAATMGDRFEILISPPTTLPVVFTEFNGNKTIQGVLLKWKTSSEQSNSHFEIRRAGEEKIFTPIGTVAPNSNGTYQLLDVSPLSGNNYYKLYQIDKDGKSAAYDKVVVVQHQLNENVSSQLSVYPTVVENNFTVKFNGDLSADRFSMKLSDVTGKEVFNKVLSKAEIFNGYSSAFPSASAGIYFATLVDVASGNQLGVVKIIKK
mgnify:FL=1